MISRRDAIRDEVERRLADDRRRKRPRLPHPTGDLRRRVIDVTVERLASDPAVADQMRARDVSLQAAWDGTYTRIRAERPQASDDEVFDASVREGWAIVQQKQGPSRRDFVRQCREAEARRRAALGEGPR